MGRCQVKTGGSVNDTTPGALSRLEPPHYSGSDGTPALRRVSRLPTPRGERAVVLYLNKYYQVKQKLISYELIVVCQLGVSRLFVGESQSATLLSVERNFNF